MCMKQIAAKEAYLLNQFLYVAYRDNTINITMMLQVMTVLGLIRVGPFFFLLCSSNACGLILAMRCFCKK